MMSKHDYTISIGKSRLKKSYLDSNAALTDFVKKEDVCIVCKMPLDEGIDVCAYCKRILED